MRYPALGLFLTAACAFAQLGEYAGPSVLSRGAGGGVAPVSPIAFRPYVNVNALYTSGLLERELRPDGTLRDDGLYGGEAALGLYGYRAWKRTVVGLNYRGDYRRYNRATTQDRSNHFLSLGITHRVSRQLEITLRQGAGSFSHNYGSFGSFGFFDPTFANIPYDELLDNRTNYLTSMADLSYIATPRLSFNFGGSGFTVRRQQSSLYGVTGANARSDIAYRVTRRTTIAVDYLFAHFGFDKAFGGSDMHSAAANYSYQINRWWQIGLRGGAMRLETSYLGTVAIDPLVAAIIGRTTGYRAFYRRQIEPTFSLQLSRAFRGASAQVSYHYGATPGNGVYLTSRQNAVSANYSYTGMRHWHFNASGYYRDLEGVGQDLRSYQTGGGGLNATRMLGSRNLYVTGRLDYRRTIAGANFRRDYRSASVGFAYSPGDVPLRLW